MENVGWRYQIMASVQVGNLKGSKGCVVCGTRTSKKCHACKSVRYCSRTCQRSEWPQHKLICTPSPKDSDAANERGPAAAGAAPSARAAATPSPSTRPKAATATQSRPARRQVLKDPEQLRTFFENECGMPVMMTRFFLNMCVRGQQESVREGIRHLTTDEMGSIMGNVFYDARDQGLPALKRANERFEHPNVTYGYEVMRGLIAFFDAHPDRLISRP